MIRQSDNKLVRPDAKGRVCLGNVTRGVSSYKIRIDCKSGEIHLKPYIEIPAAEQWVFNHFEVLNSISVGIQQSQGDRLIKRESFAPYLKRDNQS